MANSSTGRLALALSSVIALAACEGGLPFGQGAESAEPAGSGEVRLVDRDVEAPEVFQVTADGLWDGRPSLGGVWVAHPDVTDPERVIIRNEANGKFVIGALFRRERETPGPVFQVSSDAAAALEMLAGAPATLNVTALRRQEVPIADETPGAMDAPEDVEAATLEDAPAPEPVADAPAAEPAPAPAPAQSSSLSKPYIQIGLFSVKANADRTGENLRAEGIIPIVEEQSASGKTYWRVIVGPSATSADRAALLRKVKGLGFNDAYFVNR